jgi:PAS domain S-box-containing protein
MKILYVEDEFAHVVLAQRTLEENIRQEFTLIHAATMRDALQILNAQPDIDLVLSDLRLPDGSGLELLKKVRERNPPPAVVLVTGQGDQEVAVAALKAGAADYLVKQSDYLHRLPIILSNAIAQNRLLREQEALRQAEVKYQSLVEQIPAVVFLDKADEQESPIYISPRVQELTGYSAEEWYQSHEVWINHIHADDRERIITRDKYSHITGTRFQEEYRLIRRDGTIIWIKEDTNLICDTNGIPLYWQGILLDITKEKESLEMIRKSEERFRRIFHASPIATCVLRMRDGNFIDANQAYLNLTGKSLQALKNQTSLAVGLWKNTEDQNALITQLQKNGTLRGIAHQYQDVPNGPKDTIAYYESIELGGQVCVLAMFYDVTEEKNAQKALQSERDFALQVLNNMGQGLTVTTKDGQFEYINPAYARMIGYQPQEMEKKFPSDFTAETSRRRLQEEKVLREHGHITTYESTLVHKDSHEVPTLITGVPRWEDGNVTGTIAVITDLTNQKKTEEALARQVQELTILHSVAIAAAESRSEDEIIERVTQIIAQIYSELCGFLLLNEDGNYLSPHPSYVGAEFQNWQNQFPISKGITGRTVSLDRVIYVADVTKEEGFIEIAHGIRAELSIPIRVNGRVIGVLDVESRIPAAFGENDKRFLNTVASSVGTAVERLRFLKEEQKRRQEAENLRQAAAAISSTLDPDQVMTEVLNALKPVIHYENASVFLLDGEWLRLAICRGFLDSEKFVGSKFPASDELFEEMKQKKRPIILEDAQIDRRFNNWGNAFQVHGWMLVPLIARGNVIGCITLDNYQVGAYSEAIIPTAMAFAHQAAAALENARLFQEQIRRSKIIEALADIANDIATTRDVMPALDQITLRALDMLNANHVAVYLLQENQVGLKTVTAHGTYQRNLLGHTIKVGEGITGNIFLQAKAEIVNDTRQDPRRITVPGTPEKEEKLESLMSAPLILRGKTIGVINAWRLKENGLFNESELNFLVGIAHQVSICLESGRLFQETSRQAQEAAAIAEVGRDISATLQLDAVLERIASYAIDLLQSETSAVYLAKSNYLYAIAAFGNDAEAIKNDPLRIGTGILGNIALQNVGEIVNDTDNDPRAVIVKGTEKNPLEHIMGVPILMKDRHTGLLAVWRTGLGAEFLPRELNFLTSMARQAAVAIENARLYDETQRRVRELEIINRVSTSLRVAQSMDEMLPILLNEATGLLNTPHGSIWRYDHAKNKLVQKIASGDQTKLKHTILSPVDGIVGKTFTTGLRHISSELKSDPLLFEANRGSMTPGLAGICIPIQSTAGPVGVLVIAQEQDKTTQEATDLLTILAEITGNSIHRVQLYEQSQRQVKRLTTLRDIDSAIASSLDLRLTLSILMDQTINHLNIDAVDIGLYQPDIQTFSYIASAGFHVPSPTRPLLRFGEGLSGKVVAKQSIVHVTDLPNAPEASNESIVRREGFVTYIGIPLIVKGQIKGVFEVFHRDVLSPTPDWMDFLHTLAGQAAIAIDSSQLFEKLQRSNQELMQAYDTTLEGWARALELRDRETEGHARRVTEMTVRLARFMGISDSEMVNIHRGVLLHDIGKMGVPDHILKKTGKLDDEEWVEMRQHPVYAYNLLSPISYLRGAIDIPYCHHEHWDGSGYPRGLKGEQIPLSARVFSVVDIWDALLSNRPYRKAWSREKVEEYIWEVAGSILDPRVVEKLLKKL